jgi:hypothetical protein
MTRKKWNALRRQRIFFRRLPAFEKWHLWEHERMRTVSVREAIAAEMAWKLCHGELQPYMAEFILHSAHAW